MGQVAGMAPSSFEPKPLGGADQFECQATGDGMKSFRKRAGNSNGRLAKGIGAGLAFGSAIGLALGNLAVGIAVGVALGAAVGARRNRASSVK